MEKFKVGEYIIYVNGDKYELGRIKRLTEDGAFICYHEGETASKTPYDLIHKLINGFTIKDTTIGGEVFKESEAKTMENNNREIIYINIDDELHQTVKGMISDDYKERFIAEYKQLNIRIKRLDKIINDFYKGELSFKLTDIELLKKQNITMIDYAKILERRAEREGIDLD